MSETAPNPDQQLTVVKPLRISRVIAAEIIVPAIVADAGDQAARRFLEFRDRALISVMTFAFARIGAVVAMRVEDYYPKGKRW